MKKFFTIFMVALMLILSSCSSNSLPSEDFTENVSIPEVAHQYTGNYQSEPVYQELMKIENCQDPDVLCQMLTSLYEEEFSYVLMTHKMSTDNKANAYSGYEAPYDDFICQSIAFFVTDSEKHNVPISSDTYLFFEGYSEEPMFMMDENATYVVSSYDISTFDDGTHAHKVNGWVISDLFMCLHKYLDADVETNDYYCDAVRYMDFYLDFENQIIEKLDGNTGNIKKTESLNPSIDILSVEIIGPTFHDLEVTYRINNISEKRGVVHLTCSGHAFQDDLHFNDENFNDDTREDGTYTYKINYGGNDIPVTFTVYYGYGEFDPYEGWSKEISETISLLYVDGVFFTETNGVIGSETIPEEEIHPLYFEGTYVGAWTTHTSGDLIEISR